MSEEERQAGAGPDRNEGRQSYFDDADTPLKETLSAYEQLRNEGKVTAIGASSYSAVRLRQALQVSQQHGFPRQESLQPLYNLYDRREFEGDCASSRSRARWAGWRRASLAWPSPPLAI